MAALAESTIERGSLRSDGMLQSYKVNGGANVGNIVSGAIAMVDTDGYLQTYAPDGMTSPKFAGITNEGVDNTAGADGADEIEVWKVGRFDLNYTSDTAATGTYGTAVQADIGKEVYAVNNDTVTTDAAKVTADVKVGRIVSLVDSGKGVKVRIDGYTC